MFTHVTLKNFKSLADVTFDFTAARKQVKRLAAVYGENGSGKTNFINSFTLLRNSILTFSEKERIGHLVNITQDNGEPLPDGIRQILADAVMRARAQNAKLSIYRMIGCDEPTEVEYGFQIGTHRGVYKLAFTDTICYERLYYFTGKRSQPIFELRKNVDGIEMHFCSRLFANKKVSANAVDLINQYWGKHSFLALLQNEREAKNEQYIKDNYLSYVFDIIDMIFNMQLHEQGAKSEMEIRPNHVLNKLSELSSGVIAKKDEPLLDVSEKILNVFFTQTYADVKSVQYERKDTDRGVQYQLYFNKLINEKIRPVPASLESAGTQQVIKIVRAILGALNGSIVVYDELELGIHDLLLSSILSSLEDKITGQFIITTHNTYLMEMLPKRAVYVINVDYEGNKEACCLDEYDIQKKNNARLLYLKGAFGGVPMADGLDYDDIIACLQSVSDMKGSGVDVG